MSVRSVARPLCLTLLLTMVSACSLFQKKQPPEAPPPPPPQQHAAAPTAEAPPIPERKPTPPHQTPAPVAAPPTQTAMLPPPPPAIVAPEPAAAPSIVGLDRAAVQHVLGAPDSRLDQPPAVIWEYEEAACMIDVYFYTDIKTGVAHALYVDVKGDDRSDERRQSCLNAFAQRAGAGGAGHATDAAAPR